MDQLDLFKCPTTNDKLIPMAKPKPRRFSMTQYEWQSHREEYNGFCIACGQVRWGETEPDARRYPCEECGKAKVYGMEELLFMGRIDLLE